ncbi:MAG: hypothetical protein RR846_09835 [Oscillospiraceae bacterium]
MTITNCTFIPPDGVENVADVAVTFDGIITVEACIYREQSSKSKRRGFVVSWPDEACFRSQYLENYYTGEVIDRYFDWKNENNLEF